MLRLLTRPAPMRQELPGMALLLAAVLVAALPHAWEQPIWITAIFAGAWLWRLVLFVAQARLPGNAIMLVLALTGGALVFSGFGTVFGQMPGTALLLIMVALKLLEIRELRDLVVTLFLSYFVIVTTYLFNQTLYLAVYSLFAAWLITAALIQVHSGRPLPLRRLGRDAGWMLVHALPIMVILFVLFPRIPGPLWGAPVPDPSAFSGLSEQMEPGDFAQLLLNEATALRVRFDGPIPAQGEQYWRAMVMTDFDGRTWRADRDRPEIPASGTTPDAIHYTATLEPTGARYLPTLEYTVVLPSGAQLLDNFEVVQRQRVTSRIHYTAAARTQGPPQWQLSEADRARALALPANAAPQARAQAALWQTLHGTDTRAIVQEALTLFSGDPFSYTLRPPLLRGDRTDAFLYQTQAGYCEHYASSFAVLMRAAGIPARVVTGYQGGQWMDGGQYLRLRHADAHAWTEVWFENRGWVRIDPTAAIAPERIESGLMSYFADDIFAPAFLRRTGLPWTTVWRLRISDWHDVATFRWEHFVLAFDPERQRQLFARAGLNAADWRSVLIALLSAFGALGIAAALWSYLRRPRPTLDPAQRCLERMSRILRRRQYPARATHETVTAYADRLGQEYPFLSQPLAAFAQHYNALRYAPLSPEEARIAHAELCLIVRGLRSTPRNTPPNR